MVIFLEWDEHRHEAEVTHTEQIRMTKLIKYAKKNGYQGITFVRPNSAERKEIDRRQQDKFAELINKIKKDKQWGVYIWYLDYPGGHRHVAASIQRKVGTEHGDAEEWMSPIFDDVHEEFSGCEAGR